MVDGVRFAVSGDRVRLLPDGRLEFLGRESVTINTGGEKVFAEEVEQAVTSHPAVADAIVVGRPEPALGAGGRGRRGVPPGAPASGPQTAS